MWRLWLVRQRRLENLFQANSYCPWKGIENPPQMGPLGRFLWTRLRPMIGNHPAHVGPIQLGEEFVIERARQKFKVPIWTGLRQPPDQPQSPHPSSSIFASRQDRSQIYSQSERRVHGPLPASLVQIPKSQVSPCSPDDGISPVPWSRASTRRPGDCRLSAWMASVKEREEIGFEEAIKSMS